MVSQFPSRWLVVEVPRPASGLSEELTIDALARLSRSGVEERADTLLAYFDTAGEPAAPILSAIRAELQQCVPSLAPELKHWWQAHEDWLELWRRGIAPRRVGERFVICPTWETPSAGARDLLILVDPGMAFGTAEHATTRGCLRLLERHVRVGQQVADVGTGSGILSVASVLLGADRVVAMDSDPRACATAEANARLNQVGEKIEVIQVTVGPEPLPEGQPFGGIVANIEAGILIPRLGMLRGGLLAGGWMILGGVLADEAEEVSSAASEVGFQLAEDDVEEGWWAAAFSG